MTADPSPRGAAPTGRRPVGRQGHPTTQRHAAAGHHRVARRTVRRGPARPRRRRLPRRFPHSWCGRRAGQGGRLRHAARVRDQQRLPYPLGDRGPAHRPWRARPGRTKSSPRPRPPRGSRPSTCPQARPCSWSAAWACASPCGRRGFRPVTTAADQPAAVLQGYAPDLSYSLLAEGSLAVAAGALFIASNADSTLPTPRGRATGQRVPHPGDRHRHRPGAADRREAGTPAAR